MAREISYRITVDDTEAKAKVQQVDSALTGVGKSAETASAGVVNYDRATQSMIRTQDLATASTEQLDAMIRGETVSLGTATAATEAATVASSEMAAAQTTAAEVTATWAESLGAAGIAVSGFVATIAPWLLAIGVAVELIKHYVDAQREAVKAEEDRIQKTDLLTRASQIAGHAVMDLKEATKLLADEQRHQLLMDPGIAAQNYIDKLTVQGKKTMDLAAEEASRTEGLASMGIVVGQTVNVEEMMNKAKADAEKAAKAAAKADQEYFDAVVKLSNKIYEMENPLRDTTLQMADLEKVGQRVKDTSLEIVDAWDKLVRKLDELQNKSKVGIIDVKDLPQDIETIGRLKEKFDQAAEAQKRLHDGLSELSQAFAQLAQISGGSLGSAVRAMGQIVGSINLAITAMHNLESATASWITKLASATSLVGDLVSIGQLIAGSHIFGDSNVTKQVENFGSLEQFIKSLNLTAQEFVDKMKQAGLSIEQLIADSHDMAKFQADLERIKKAFDDIDAAAQHTKDLLDEASSKYGPSQADLDAAEKHAHEIFDAMLAAGTYTQEQLNKAYYDWQKAMADAGNEAAKAWVAAHDAATKATADQNAEIQKLQSRYDELNNFVSQEAPEEQMGVIEQQQRAQMDVIKKQIDDAKAAAQAKADADAKAAQDSADSIKHSTDDWAKYAEDRGSEAADNIYREFDGIEIHIPIIFDVPSLPVVPQAAGGDWMVNKPTLFLAGEAGPERATFTPMSGGSKSSGGGGVSIGNITVNASGADLQDMQAFAPKFIEGLRRNTGGMYDAVQTVASRVA